MTSASSSSPRALSTPSSAAEKNGLKILQLVLDQALAKGAPLPSQPLAQALGLSRFPIQQALAWLHEQGWADQPTGRGYALAATPAAIRRKLSAKSMRQIDPHVQLALDRLHGHLPKEITESELARRYGLTRMQLASVLNRLAQEGWIQRKHGQGWRFADIIDSVQAHANASYIFRMAIEPAALLAPTYALDVDALARLRAEQIALRDGGLQQISKEDLFEAGVRFHETLVGFSNNPFFVSSIERVSRLRRLMEHDALVHPPDFLAQCKEHLALLDLLESNRREEAAEFIRRHLDKVRDVKLRTLAQRDMASVDVHF